MLIFPEIKHLKYYIIFVLSTFAINEVVLADSSTTQLGNSYFKAQPKQSGKVPSAQNKNNYESQIGNSYFQGTPTKANSSTHTISQIGPTMEEHQRLIDFYLFINQLFPNQFFYEFRALVIYNYISQYPPAPPLVPKVIPVASERNPMGYGGSGTFGYNFFINSNVSFMPFIRLNLLTNWAEAYRDILGNSINSVNYGGFIGGKLSMRVNKLFAIYTQYFAGYVYARLSGRGVFLSENNPTLNILASTLEFGAPYRVNDVLSVTPYMQLLTSGVNPSIAALNSPYNISPLTNSSMVFALKLGWDF